MATRHRLLFLITAIALLLLSSPLLQAETIYKYTNKNGTVVFTKILEEVPIEQREKVEEVVLSDENTEALLEAKEELIPEEPFIPKEALTKEKLREIGTEKIRQGKETFASFFEDQQTLFIGYIIGGIIAFFIFSKILKRFVGGFVTMILVKLAIVVVLFCGVYIFYLSWLNKSVLNFDQVQDISEGTWTEQMTTPAEILEKSQDVVDQFNQKAKERETLLNGMGGS